MDIKKDFSRNVWCLLGIPLDAITLEQTADQLLSAAKARETCFLSTPNLNYLSTSVVDNDFRTSVINSDLSVTDGFPMIWVAKFLSIPLPERVPGSGLMEYLFQRNTQPPLRVFFFGGEPGVGEIASQKINEKPSGLLSVGHFAPGFGTVEEMSSIEIIDNINRHDVELLIVSISAKKGQAWIEKNKHLLKAPIYSHLGAVINFFAGTVKRAPIITQRFCAEWLWRIYQEPSLWRRYFNDGLCFLNLLANNVFPYWFWLNFSQPKVTELTLLTQVSEDNKDLSHVALTGVCIDETNALIRELFSKLAQEKRDVILDLANVKLIDGAFLGLCLLLHKHLNAAGRSVKLVNGNKDISRILHWQRVDDLLA